MSTRRTSQAATAMIGDLARRGVTVSGMQIERHTGGKQLPDITIPYPARYVDYYAEFFGLLQPRRKPKGILAVLAFRGYFDIVNTTAFYADMLQLLKLADLPDRQPDLEGDDSLWNEAPAAVARYVEDARRQRNPERSAFVDLLRSLSGVTETEHAQAITGGNPSFQDRTDYSDSEIRPIDAILQQGEVLRSGGRMRNGLELLDAVRSLDVEITDGRASRRVRAGGQGNRLDGAERLRVGDRLNRIDPYRLRRAIVNRPVVDLVHTAHIVYPLFAFSSILQGDMPERRKVEESCMKVGPALRAFMLADDFNMIEDASKWMADELGLHPNQWV